MSVSLTSVPAIPLRLVFAAALLLTGVSPARAVPDQPYRSPTPFVRTGGPGYEEHLAAVRERLRDRGYREWSWEGQLSRCRDCPIFILPRKREIETAKVYAFIRQLEVRRAELIDLYDADPQEYNLLARMAVGILGRESEFFESPRYLLKENAQWAIRLIKVVRIYLEGSNRDPGLNSRGPTQIKIVPGKIAAAYGVEVDELYRPENAALATMGYLIEALAELKRRVELNHLDFITPDTYADYLPYIYFGSKRQLLNRTATPERNIYIRDMRKYMTWIEIHEGPPRATSLPRP